MAIVKVTGDQSGRPFNTQFRNSQIDFQSFLLGTEPDLVVGLSNKEYRVFDGIDPTFTRTSIITGKLGVNLPTKKRKIKSFTTFLKEDGQEFFRLEIDKITGLNFRDFTNPNIDSLKKILKSDDLILGRDGLFTLTGYRGDDEILLGSFNTAIGGPGADTFTFSQNTRQALVLDFNPRKDRIAFVDDAVENYEFIENFGGVAISNKFTGGTIAVLDSIEFEDVAARELSFFAADIA